jgi:hypothetical protein
MRRAMIAWAGIGLMLLAAGCTMCAHPYDYCGPVVDGPCACSCDPLARSGSILSGGGPGAMVEGGQMVGQSIDGQALVEQATAGQTIVGQPVITDGPAIRADTADAAPTLPPVPAGARRYTPNRSLR